MPRQKLPTVEAPTGWKWVSTWDGYVLSRRIDDAGDSTTYNALYRPTYNALCSRQRRDIYAALVAAYDELNGGENA